MSRFGPVVLALAVAVTALPVMAGERALIMFERDGCSYCKRWNEQIGPAYPKTAEGQAAPLLRLDIKDQLPPGVTLTGAPPVFTPTFVLTDDGTEVGRIEGYAGDEFFWVMLAQMLVRNGWDPSTPAAPVSDDRSPADGANPAPTGTLPGASATDPATPAGAAPASP